LTATATNGVGFSYQIVASNSPASYSTTVLPTGLNLNAATGVISGTTTATGSSNVTISAINTGGTGSATLALTVLPPPPVITSALTATATDGVGFSYQIVASNSPASYSTGVLPAGLSLNAASGLVSGTTTATGTSNVTISAINTGGTGSATLKISFQTRYAAWQSLWFTPAQLADSTVSGDDASPARDGIPNLMKYALNLNPLADGVNGLPVESTVEIGGSNYLRLSYKQLIVAPDITYIPEVSGDMRSWDSGTAYLAPVSATTNGDGVTETIVVEDLTPATWGAPRFIRLRVSGP
jgi:hypothetical protein